MLFKKGYGELVQDALAMLKSSTDITNTNIGGITRSLIEVINRNIADYYDILDINMAMSFLSTAEGYFLDLFGEMFNMPRLRSSAASASVSDKVQKFYVTSGTLHNYIPTDLIPQGTLVSTVDGLISYTVSTDTSFGVSATEVYVPVVSQRTGSQYNIGINTLVVSSLSVDSVFTTNEGVIVSGADTESDSNYRYRLSNATVAAEKANEIAVRLAALSVSGVADVIIKPFARGVGSYEVMVIPSEGIANTTLVNNVQTAIEAVQAAGIKGTSRAPSVVAVDLAVKVIFIDNVTEYEQNLIRINIKSAIERYIANIPIGGEFIVNELRQQIMDVSTKIKDHVISCYYFRNKPHFVKNVKIYWDEQFYPNPSNPNAITVM